MDSLEVLIVEDNAVMRVMLKDALGPLGCKVTECKDGEEALGLMATRSFRVILLDLVMPKKSGLDVLRELRAKGIKSQVVIITSLDSKTLEEQARADGAAHFLAKPFHPLDVENAVRAALEGA